MKRTLALVLVLLALGGCGPATPTLAGGKPVAYWLEALHGPDAKLRKTAAFKLGNVGPADAAVVPVLTAALKDRDAGVRREAILALMKCGVEAREAIPALTELQQHDRDAQVRIYAAKALRKLQKDADAA
jgi:HEAT repeat protein